MNKKILFAFALTLTTMLSSCGTKMPEPYKTTSVPAASPISTEAAKPAAEAAAVSVTTAAPAKTEETTAPAKTEETTTAQTKAENTPADVQAVQAVTMSNDNTAAPAQPAAETTDAPAAEDLFSGNYRGDIHTRATLKLSRNDDGSYNALIRWSGSAFEWVEWEFSGEFNGRQVLHFNNCTMKSCTGHEDGSMETETVYTNGTGYISISEESAERVGFIWKDDIQDAGKGVFFVKE